MTSQGPADDISQKAGPGETGGLNDRGWREGETTEGEGGVEVRRVHRGNGGGGGGKDYAGEWCVVDNGGEGKGIEGLEGNGGGGQERPWRGIGWGGVGRNLAGEWEGGGWKGPWRGMGRGGM